MKGMPTLMKADRPLHSMSEAVEDVRRVLTITFRGVDSLARADLERTLSFDMEWVAPHESEAVVEALVRQGWLSEDNGLLTLNVPLGDVSVPFGWFPRPTRLLNPVSAQGSEPSASDPAPSASPQTAPAQPIAASAPTGASHVEHSADPRASLTKRLVRFIARQSGLEMAELQRRAERKTRAFHLITPWMAYALVAREQGLEMEAIVDALAVV